MKCLKKILLLAVLLIVINVQRSYAAKGLVTTDGVRIRKSPSTSSDIITVLNKSATVEIIEDAGDWYKIRYTESGNYEGYMKKDFIKKQGNEDVPANNPTQIPTVAPTLEPTQSPIIEETKIPEPTIEPTIEPIPEPEVPEITIGNQVTNTNVKVYSLPTVASSVIDTLKKDTTVNVCEIAGKFVYIRYNNKFGWIRVSTLQRTTQDTYVNEPVDPTPTYTEKVGYVNVTQAIIRSKATTSSEMVTALNYNSQVTIIGEENDFYKIKINGKEAFIAKRLISDTKQTTNRSSVQRGDVSAINVTTEETTTETITEKIVNKVEINNPTGAKIAEMAKSFLGYKYVYGGASPLTGFDCSGFVYYIYTQLGYDINRTADDQVNNGVYVEKQNLQQGDLVFFSNYKTHTGIGHVGIYIGNNEFIHASTASTGVIISSLNSDEYVGRYVTARRIY